MSEFILLSLPTLQNDSGVHIATSIVHGFHSSQASVLTRPELRSGEWGGVPRNGTQNLLSNLRHEQKLLSLTAAESGFIRTLNNQLKGGHSYPVLNFALGTAVGLASGGAGLIFGASTLALDLNRRDSDVLARKGDEIWVVEEIGKSLQNNTFSEDGFKAEYVKSYFLYDPFRAKGFSESKGWLLHESRGTVFLD